MSAPNSIWWESGILCHMPSPAQPWMLPCASWERYARNGINGGGGAPPSTDGDGLGRPDRKGGAIGCRGRMEGWTTVFRDYGGQSKLLMLSCVGNTGPDHERDAVPKGTCTILHAGSYCCITDEVKAILCFYGEDYKLKGVSIQEGYITK